MSQMCPQDEGRLGTCRRPRMSPPVTSFVSSASAGRSGTASTACLMAVRCSGASAAGYFTKRTAEAHLGDLLDQARRGTLEGMVRTGATFSGACDDYLHWLEHARARKSSALTGCPRRAQRAPALPHFGGLPLEDVTTREIERWLVEWRGFGSTTCGTRSARNGRARRPPRAPGDARPREHHDDRALPALQAAAHARGEGRRSLRGRGRRARGRN